MYELGDEGGHKGANCTTKKPKVRLLSPIPTVTPYPMVAKAATNVRNRKSGRLSGVGMLEIRVINQSFFEYFQSCCAT
jgi:hypothetical protein